MGIQITIVGTMEQACRGALTLGGTGTRLPWPVGLLLPPLLLLLPTDTDEASQTAVTTRAWPGETCVLANQNCDGTVLLSRSHLTSFCCRRRRSSGETKRYIQPRIGCCPSPIAWPRSSRLDLGH